MYGRKSLVFGFLVLAMATGDLAIAQEQTLTKSKTALVEEAL